MSCCLLLGPNPATGQSSPKFGQWGVDLASLDKTVKPGDNFYLHVNGGWTRMAAIQADRSSTGTFQDLEILSEERLKTIVADLERTPKRRLSPEERKLRDLYDAFVDTVAIEARGPAPVQKDLDYLAGLKTRDDVGRAMASLRLSTGSIFNIGVGVDDKNPDRYSVILTQGGLGMPDRDYYLSNNDAIVKVRAAYRKYLVDTMTLAGLDNSNARADRVLALETEIAKVSWARADRHNEDRVYNPMPVSALKTLAPDFAWDAFLAEVAIPLKKPDGSERDVIVTEKTAFAPLAAIFRNTPLSTWRDYLTVHYLHASAPYLPKQFDDLDFSFYGTVLTGRTRQLDRQTRAMHLLNQRMTDALGKLYVARYFPPETRAKANILAAHILEAYKTSIQTLDWMAPATRVLALGKLRQLTVKIGSPDTWHDYAGLQVLPDDPVGNAQRSAVFEWARSVDRLDQAVNRKEWGLTPSSINAYYNLAFNEVVFPAGILEPPFFDPAADPAVNYGAIGAVMGVQIGEALFGAGSQTDGRGFPSNWWTKQDYANFNTRTAALVKQYDGFEPLPGVHVSGQNTLGQNIADNAGLTMALKAYHLSLGGKPAPVIDGFTGDQRLYLAFAQIWRAKFRNRALIGQALSSEYGVTEFRVIGSTRNMDAWYDAFAVKPGEKYYLAPPERVHLW